jgi:hypothetical protein
MTGVMPTLTGPSINPITIIIIIIVVVVIIILIRPYRHYSASRTSVGSSSKKAKRVWARAYI